MVCIDLSFCKITSNYKFPDLGVDLSTIWRSTKKSSSSKHMWLAIDFNESADNVKNETTNRDKNFLYFSLKRII